MTEISRSGDRWRSRRRRVAALAIVAVISGIGGGFVAVAASKETTYATPAQAVDGLVAALRAGSTDQLLRILGPASRRLISSGDPVADAQARAKFISEYENAHDVTMEDDKRAVLAVGDDRWSFPFPIVREGDAWRFDAAEGVQEVIDRRIGANELDAIAVCRAYVDAQNEYAIRDPDHTGFLQYAQKIASSPGKRDGLYWAASADEKESPIGPLMARARAEGYGSPEANGARKPYHGYYYRILKGQGPAARDGAYDYVVQGHMIGGFALVAFPAGYGASGIMTFIVNQDGVVYQKDLGPQTSTIAAKMTLFDPDPSWTTTPSEHRQG